MKKVLTCLIVDDEPPAIRILQKYAAQLPELNCVATTTKAVEVLQLVAEHQPDILFMDIQMPGLTGLQLSKLLKGQAQIILTTAYGQFAMESYELEVTDYLLKPISFDRFIKAVEKAKRQIQHYGEGKKEQTDEQFFFVKTDGKNRFKKIKINDIYYLESIKNYVVFQLKNEQVVTYNTLKYFEENLPQNVFVKIHKSYIVSLHKVEKTDTNSVWVLNKELPLGNTYKNEFFKRIDLKSI